MWPIGPIGGMWPMGGIGGMFLIGGILRMGGMPGGAGGIMLGLWPIGGGLFGMCGIPVASSSSSSSSPSAPEGTSPEPPGKIK
jgi:hypothetical protein